MSEEIVILVDEDDNVIGKEVRSIVEKKSLLCRSGVSIVLNSKNELFVHKRSMNCHQYPGKWDVKAGGMVPYGQNYEESTIREVNEELGIKDAKLVKLFEQKFRSNTHNVNRTVFMCKYEGPFTLQKEEVEEGQFMNKDEIRKLYDEDKLSPTAKQIFDTLCQKELI